MTGTEATRKQTIGIIGGGVLGQAIARGFMEHADVKVFDKLAERRTHGLGEVARCDIVFLSLPTPSLPDGRCDTSAVSDMLATCADDRHWTATSCYVIRSTVPIGFTHGEAAKRDFNLPLLHSPEFLTARCAIVDFQTPSRNIIGNPHYAVSSVPASTVPASAASAIAKVPAKVPNIRDWMEAEARLNTLYARRFPGVPIFNMTSDASELVKLGCNTFFATKVTLFNLLYDLAKANGLDWDDVRSGILSDGRIAHAHTSVNADSHARGYSGTCLPKDLADLYHCCAAAGVDNELLKAIHQRNARTRGDDPGLAKINLPEPHQQL